jgi:hypothetical protein
VHVSDSGSDIFDCMAVCRQQQKHFLIRAFRNRQLVWPSDSPEAAEPTAQAVLDYVQGLEPQPGSEYTVTLPAEGAQPARQAHLALQWAAITLAPPVQAPPEIRAHGPLKVWLVRAWEPDPPPGVEAIAWVVVVLARREPGRCPDTGGLVYLSLVLRGLASVPQNGLSH